VNFAFSPEQEELRRAARRFLAEAQKRLRTTMEGEGHDSELWMRMARELGWMGLTIPESFGGVGLGQVELAAIMEEMGRTLLCAPFFSTVCLAANALMVAGSRQQKRDHLPGIAAGETVATLAYTEPNGRWDASGIQALARRDGADYVLSGLKSFVPDGHLADLLIVAARAPESAGQRGISLFLLPRDARGLHVRKLETLDTTRRQAEVLLDGVRVPAAARLGDEGAGWAALELTLDLAAVALAAEQVGGAERCLDMAVDYAKVRVQFGRPIGTFQAVKHKCADMLLQVEAARSAAYWAAWVAQHEVAELAVAAPLAKATCSEAFYRCAAENIQVHGGIGFTWEHDAHLYFKRAKSSELCLGAPAFHRERLARRIGLDEVA
jgi:alkylation response protein AidB-like acyl-CoA dehydrogenase